MDRIRATLRGEGIIGSVPVEIEVVVRAKAPPVADPAHEPAPATAPVPEPEPPAAPEPAPAPPPTRALFACPLSMPAGDSDAPSGAVAQWAMCFRPGDFDPARESLLWIGDDGARVPVQADVVNRHGDGTVRWATLSLALPGAIPQGETRTGAVHAGPRRDPAPAAFALAELLASGGGLVVSRPDYTAPWVMDLAAAMEPHAWRDGPVAAERRFRARVPEAACGARGLEVWLDAARTPRGWRFEVALRHIATPMTGQHHTKAWPLPVEHPVAAYRVVLLHDGQRLLDETVANHGFGASWTRERRTDGPAPQARPSVPYLAEAGALLPYADAPPSEARVAQMLALRNRPDWNAPLGVRAFTANMGTTGNRSDIGWLHGWDAALVCSGWDPRLVPLSADLAEAAQTMPTGLWSEERDREAGRADWPDLSPDMRAPRCRPVRFRSVSPWAMNQSHQPQSGLAAWIATGRRSFHDAVLFQGFWASVASAPRTSVSGLAVDGLVFLPVEQVRGAAWNLRSLGNAAWVASDHRPETRSILERTHAAQYEWLARARPVWEAECGGPSGYLRLSGADPKAISPWQNDHFVKACAADSLRGVPGARAQLEWMAGFLVGRFEGPIFAAGAHYQIARVPDPARVPAADNPVQTTWEALWANHLRLSAGGALINGPLPWGERGNYARLARSSLVLLALALDGSDLGRRALLALDRMEALGAPSVPERERAPGVTAAFFAASESTEALALPGRPLAP